MAYGEPDLIISICDRCSAHKRSSRAEARGSVCHECSRFVCPDCTAHVIREAGVDGPEIALCQRCDLTPGMAEAIREEHGIRSCAEV